DFVNPTITSPKLAALRAQACPLSPTPSRPPKKRPTPTISLVPPPATRRQTAQIFVKPVWKRSMRLADRGGPSKVASKESTPIANSNDPEPEKKLEDTIPEVVKMDEASEEDPEEDPEWEKEEEEDPSVGSCNGPPLAAL
ncbi:hypothetical protein PIB30_089232, partial [Stylosanthes scabra]|nr:hypothetical protein [Stylosanthes scabra]